MEEAASSTKSSDNLNELSKPEDAHQATIMEQDNAALVILLKAFEYLSVPDLLRASQVAKIWNYAASHDILWRKVRLINCYLKDYDGLYRKLLKHCSEELVIEDIFLFISHEMTPDDLWNEIFKKIKTISSLKTLKLCGCYIKRGSSTEVIKDPKPKVELDPSPRSHYFDMSQCSSLFSLEKLSLKRLGCPVILNLLRSQRSSTFFRLLPLTRESNLYELVMFLPLRLKSLELSFFCEISCSIAEITKNEINANALAKLTNLEDLCLSDETGNGIDLSDTQFLKCLNELKCLKLTSVYSQNLLNDIPSGLRSLSFDSKSVPLDVRSLSKLIFLKMLTIRDEGKRLLLDNVSSFSSLRYLKSLNLRGVRNTHVIEKFLPPSLESLKVGDCDSLTSSFFDVTIPRLNNLKRLELENGLAAFPTNDLLNIIPTMPKITSLSLLNMEFKRGFWEPLSRCTNLEFLHISPHCSKTLDSLSIHQEIIYCVASLKDTLKYFTLGFDTSFLDLLNSIDKCIVKVLTLNYHTKEDEMSIFFVNPSCVCSQPCLYSLHAVMIPLEAIEKEIFPNLLPKTCAKINKSGLAIRNENGELECVHLPSLNYWSLDHSKSFNVVKCQMYERYRSMFSL